MKIKLIIWDLDDTLWSGTLADGDDVVLHSRRAEAIRTLNTHGLVSAIVSKNDPEAARAALVRMGMWDAFVFPRIGFAPKGETVRDLIADMQLRPQNVLFLDDNRLNLEEVRWTVPEINVADASSDACDRLLDELLHAHADVDRNRVDEYRLLERKTADRAATSGSNEDFLRSCDIRVVVPQLTDNLDFADRLEELANRSNQLNFTGSRFAPGELAHLISQHFMAFHCWSVFAADRYGSHGLVGFAAVSQHRTIEHFFFSCRIMHMGIEGWLLHKMKRQLPDIDVSRVPVTPLEADWINEEAFDGDARAAILREHSQRTSEPELRFMLDCQSASVAHYAGLIDRAETDLNPRVFKLKSIRKADELSADMPPALVYGAFVDYKNSRAPGRAREGVPKRWDDRQYEAIASRFARLVASSGRRMLVLLAPENAPMYGNKTGVTLARVRHYNAIWRTLAGEFGPALTLLDLTDLNLAPGDVIDVRHYGIPLLQRAAAEVRRWFDDASPAPAQPIEGPASARAHHAA